MSLTRAIRRAAFRKQGKEWPSRQVPTKIEHNAYAALHPTRGWRWFSNARLGAQRKMAAILDHMPNPSMRRAKPNDPRINRHTGEPHTRAREIARRARKGA